MIVQCPSCASRYRIRDANIPPSGGKIRCPSCSHAFIVYPESAADDDGDRTSVTSQGDISSLVNQMAQSQVAADEEDRVSTQIASNLDRDRALAALANELGDPLEQDGTVEIQNPMKVWQEAQNALRQASGAPTDDYDEDDDVGGATEVVDPNALAAALKSGLPAPGIPAAPKPPPRPSGPLGAPPQPQAPAPPTPFASAPAPAPPAPAPAAFQSTAPARRDSDAGLEDSGQYAPHTPPGGRHTFESWDQPAPATVPSPSVGMFERSPSGLTSAALFDDDDQVPNIAPLRNPTATPPPGPGFGAPAFGDPGLGAPAANPGFGAPAAEAAPPAGGADANHPGPWKLKTNFGLTYEFPDTRGLRSWLSSREELDGYTVSADDGATFQPLNAFPQLDKSAPRSPSMSGNFSMAASQGSGTFPSPSGSGQFPAHGGFDAPSQGSGLHRQPTGGMPIQNPTGGFKGPVVNTEYRPPSREAGSNRVLWAVFLLLFVVAVFSALETFEIFKISDVARSLGILPAETPAATSTANPGTTTPTPTEPAAVDPAELARQQEAEVTRLLKDAERLVKGNKLPAALETLQTTEKIAPENIAVHDLKASVYEKLGQADEAAASKAKADELRAAQAPAAGPDAGTVADEADGGK